MPPITTHWLKTAGMACLGGLLMTEGIVTSFDKASSEKFVNGIWEEQDINDDIVEGSARLVNHGKMDWIYYNTILKMLCAALPVPRTVAFDPYRTYPSDSVGRISFFSSISSLIRDPCRTHLTLARALNSPLRFETGIAVS